MDQKYNREIAALRGVAIILTLCAHWTVAIISPNTIFATISAWAQFWPGVYLFFVISGFVITLNFYERLNNPNRFETRNFFIRRFFRLAPAGMTWIAITLVLALLFPQSFGDRSRNVVQAVAATFWFYNFAWTYWSPSFGVYWSLSMEEQFYAAFPFLVRMPAPALVWLCAGTIVVFFFVYRPPIVSKLVFFPVDALCWGVLIALLKMKSAVYATLESFRLTRPVPKYITQCVLLVLLVMVPARLQEVTAGTSITTALCAAIVFLASLNRGHMTPAWPLDNLLQKMGTVSYELYLCHMPMLLLASTISRAFMLSMVGQIIVIVFALVFAFILADVTQRWISQRSKKIGLRLSHSIPAA